MAGRNPNVYFEAGMAFAWNKNWIVLAQSAADLSFDVQHVRTLLYSNRMGADVQLRESLRRGSRRRPRRNSAGIKSGA